MSKPAPLHWFERFILLTALAGIAISAVLSGVWMKRPKSNSSSEPGVTVIIPPADAPDDPEFAPPARIYPI